MTFQSPLEGPLPPHSFHPPHPDMGPSEHTASFGLTSTAHPTPPKSPLRLFNTLHPLLPTVVFHVEMFFSSLYSQKTFPPGTGSGEDLNPIFFLASQAEEQMEFTHPPSPHTVLPSTAKS